MSNIQQTLFQGWCPLLCYHSLSFTMFSISYSSWSCSPHTLAAMAAAVMCEEELSSVEATPLSFFSSSSSSHWTPLSSVCLCGLVVGGGDRGGGGEGKSSSSSCTSFTLTMASRSRSMAWGSAGRMNWKHSCGRRRVKVGRGRPGSPRAQACDTEQQGA